MKVTPAEIIQEFGPFPGLDHIHGVSHDGQLVWFASGDKLNALDPATGLVVRSIDMAAHAGTAFDGRYLYQLGEDRIQKVDPESGEVVSSIPAPGAGEDSGLAWAEGCLWVGHYRARKIHQIDADTGKLLRTIETKRFVTGVAWLGNELWHGTIENNTSDVTRIDPETGKVLERIEMPAGVTVSGLDNDGKGLFFCGGSKSGKVRVVKRQG